MDEDEKNNIAKGLAPIPLEEDCNDKS